METSTIVIIAVVILLVLGAGFYFYKNPGLVNNGASVSPSNSSPAALNEIGLQLVAQGLASPVAFVPANDGTGRVFLVDQVGLIKILNSSGQVLAENFLDLRDKLASLNETYDERGLLGLALHPKFKENGRLFVYYGAPGRAGLPAGWSHTNRLAEFKVSKTDPNTADKSSEKIILQIDKPQSNHNGGHIVFGPDGYLYVPVGDGGGANDTGLGHTANLGNGQDRQKLLGKILRLDVDKGMTYAIPADNPFNGSSGKAEIFAYGFRNPYHVSFDAGGAKQLFVADVGQNLWEEVDIVEKGKNYGWNIKEANHCFDPKNPNASPATCSSVGAQGEALVNPIIEYRNSAQAGGLGMANVGGYVYRGSRLASLVGNYVFGDFNRTSSPTGDGSIFAASQNNGVWAMRELKIAGKASGRLGLYIKGLGQDAAGELYVLTTETLGPAGDSGKIYRIVAP